MTALIALFCASACCNHADKPENVIYLIGDGMGFGAVTTLLYTEDEVTGFEMASAIGLSETSSADNYTTDSAQIKQIGRLDRRPISLLSFTEDLS